MMDPATTHEKIKQLRTIQSNDLNLRKAAIGGYQCKDVEEYIGNLLSNMGQAQKAFDEKIEEYNSKISILLQERERLLQNHQNDENKIEQLLCEIRKITQREAPLLQEVERLHESQAKEQVESIYLQENEHLKDHIKNLENEITLNHHNKEEIEKLSKQNAALSKINHQVTAENKALMSNIDQLNRRLEVLKEENEQRQVTIDTLTMNKKSLTENMNIKLYQYKLHLDSNIDYASQYFNKLLELINNLKTDASELYDNMKVSIDNQD